MAKKRSKSKETTANGRRALQASPTAAGNGNLSAERSYSIPDYRLERFDCLVRQVATDDGVRYEVTGDLSAPVPPIRESQYLSPQQCVEIYRWMLLNRKMEQALENLYKQGKVVGGVYFGLGQEACSCASAYALRPEDWLAPMIRNQGSLLVRGFSARDVMMQYMAKAGSPTFGKDASSHFGDPQKRNVCAPISTLGPDSGDGGRGLGRAPAGAQHRGPHLYWRWRTVYGRHLRRLELCRRAEVGAGADCGKQSLGLLHAFRHAVPRKGPGRARHRLRHSGRNCGRHRRLPGL